MVTTTVDTLGWSAACGLIIMCWQEAVCAELLILANGLVMAEFLTSKALQWPWYVPCHWRIFWHPTLISSGRLILENVRMTEPNFLFHHSFLDACWTAVMCCSARLSRISCWSVWERSTDLMTPLDVFKDLCCDTFTGQLANGWVLSVCGLSFALYLGKQSSRWELLAFAIVPTQSPESFFYLKWTQLRDRFVLVGRLEH